MLTLLLVVDLLLSSKLKNEEEYALILNACARLEINRKKIKTMVTIVAMSQHNTL